MSAIFDSKTLGPTERLVMLALADHADDEGKCYPSIQRLKERTGLSERAVQTNVKKLVDLGYLSVSIGGGKGNANLYFVSPNPAAGAPRTKCTPAADAPQTPQQVRPNPAADAPEPSGTTIEPPVSSAREVSGVLERWASARAVTSFLAYRRKHKSRGLTLTGAERLAKTLADIFQAGGDCDDALGLAEERGWASVEADWYFREKAKSNGTGTHRKNTPQGTQRPDPALEQIARLTGIGSASRDGRGGVGSAGEEDGSLWLGARPQ